MQAQLMDVDVLHPSPENPRRSTDVAELVASIRSIGLLEPLVVSPNGEGFLVVCGHRRLAAAKQAGLAEVPVVVREMTQTERVEAMIVENLQRHDLAPLEEAEALQRLVDLGMSQADVAARVGCSQSHVSKRLALLELPAPAKEALDSGGITVGDALELTKLKDTPKVVAELLASAERDRGRAWKPTIPDMVETELDLREVRAKAEATRAELEASGVTVLDWPKHGWYGQSKTRRLDMYEVNIPRGKHAKEPCHAAGVDPRDGETVYLCTDPGRHKTNGESKVTTAQARKRAKELAQQKALRAAAADRTALVKKLLKKPMKGDTAIALAAVQLIGELHKDGQKVACALLELEVPETKRHGYTERDYDGPLRDRAKRSGPSAQQVLVALALAVGEQKITASWGWDTPVTDAHYAFLERFGWQKTEAELALIQERTKGSR